jgi:hypothetical protein
MPRGTDGLAIAARVLGIIPILAGVPGTVLSRSPLSVVDLVPSQRGLTYGDHEIVCFVESDSSVTGTLRSSRR